MIPTVLDIASEVREEGIDVSGGLLEGTRYEDALKTKDLSAAFGSQDWKDDSWAGRAGYIAGTAGGILTGIGAVGKG